MNSRPNWCGTWWRLTGHWYVCMLHYTSSSSLARTVDGRIPIMHCGIIRRNRSCSTNDSAYCYTFLPSVVWRLSLSHSCFLLEQFGVIWQVHLNCVVGYNNVLAGCLTPSEEGEMWNKTCDYKLQPNSWSFLPPGKHKRAIPPFCLINLVFC